MAHGEPITHEDCKTASDSDQDPLAQTLHANPIATSECGTGDHTHPTPQSHSQSSSHPDTTGNRNCNIRAHSHADSDANGHCDPHPDGYPYGESLTNPDSNELNSGWGERNVHRTDDVLHGSGE